MKWKIENEKKWLHDARSHLGVIQTYLDCTQHLVKNDEQKVHLENSRQGLLKIVKILENLSTGQQNYLMNQISDESAGIMVIDDDSHVRDLFSERLGKKGIKVITLERGEDLLNHNFDFSKISSVIVDFNFENSALDGFDIVEYLRNFSIKTIHLCTGEYDDPSVIKKAQDLGVASIISKPLPEDFWARF